MKKFRIVLLLLSFVFIGCGGDSSETNPKKGGDTNDPNTKLFVAKDNTLHDVNSTFGIFNVLVYTDKELANTLSNGTKAIYGKINGVPTNALLSVNSNYKNGTVFIVKVFKNNKLVGESSKNILSGTTLEFSNITTK